MSYLPAARALAALADGALLLVDEETLASVPVAGLTTVTALSAAAPGGSSASGGGGGGCVARLVAVARLPRRRSRAAVLSIVSGAGAVRVGAGGVGVVFGGGVGGGSGRAAAVTHETSFPDPAPATGAAWAGGGAAVLASASRYALWRPSSGEVLTLIAFPADSPAVWPLAVPVRLPGATAATAAAGGAAPPTSPAPSRPAVLLLVDQAGVVVGPDGTPTGPGLTFCPSSGPPSALAAAGGRYVVAAGGAGLEVHDLVTGARVGSLPFPGGARPAPGQRLLAASACSGAGLAVVSGARKAWALVPITPAEQAAAALRGGDAAGALAAVGEDGGGGGGGAPAAPWAAAAAAAAGLLLCGRGDWAAGGAALAAAQPGADFEPCELWWCGGGVGGLVEAAVAAAGEEEGDRERAAAAAARARRAAALGLAGEVGTAPPPSPAPPSSAAAAAVLLDALLRARRAGATRPTGDAVAAALLAADAADAAADAADAAAVPPPGRRLGALVDALAGTPHGATSLAAAGAALQASGLSDALAALRVAARDPAGALAVWREVAQGAAGAPAPPTAAVAAAARLLAEPDACPDPALVTLHAPWILLCEGVGQDDGDDDEGEGEAATDEPPLSAGVAALAARAPAVPPAAALALLAASPRARRQYLAAVLLGDGRQGGPACGDSGLRSQLALALARRAAALSSRTASSSPALASVRASLARLLDPAAWDGPIADAPAISAALDGTRLWAERAAALEVGGDAQAAVRLLALSARDVGAARAVGARAAARGGDADADAATARVDAADAALLALLLHPPPLSDGDEAAASPPPLLAEAAALVSHPAVRLDPAAVLGAMPDGTPLSVAGPILARLLAARSHGRRTAAVTRGLARGALAAASAARADVLGRVVLVPAGGRACGQCRARIGVGRVFSVDGRSGAVTCGACAGAGGGAKV